MQIFCTEKLLHELAERVVISGAGTCMVVVDKLASQKSCSEGPAQSKSALSSFFAMAIENRAGELKGEVSRT